MTSVLLFTALAITAPALKDPPRAQSLVGEWNVESVALAGRPQPATSSGLRYTFTRDGKWLIHRNGKELAGTDRGYTIDVNADPPTVDLTTNTSRRAGIYKLEGNRLTICAARARDARPKSFDPKAQEGVTVYTLTRVKKD